MGEQVLNQFRSNKARVAIYEALGMDLNTAFRMFMERTRMARGLPFPAVLPENWMTKAGTHTATAREEAEDAEIRADGTEREMNR